MSQIDFLSTVEPESQPTGNPSGNYIWWSALLHGGGLITPSRLTEFFPEHAVLLASWDFAFSVLM